MIKPFTLKSDYPKVALKGNGNGRARSMPGGNQYQQASNGRIKALMTEEVGAKAYEFVRQNIDLQDKENLVISTTTRFNILNQGRNQYNNLVNLKRINDIRRINKFFEIINDLLPINGLFIGNAETYSLRKCRILKKYPPVLNWIFYSFDFVIKRVFPKLKLTQKLYFFLTHGNNRVISRAETLGRLYSCGFEIKETKEIKGQLYFVARKVGKPSYDYQPTYGPLVKLKRIGKNGKLIRVYKMRTMHAYSEYLQAYIYDNNNLQKGGKFRNDFRITTLGRIMRKFWIDELPMFINVMKGEMKIVGVRPLSKHFYDLYDEDLKQERIKYRPGLIPPFYADMPATMAEIQDSERKYLKAYAKRPLLTDWRYFWQAMWNIFVKNARSN